MVRVLWVSRGRGYGHATVDAAILPHLERALPGVRTTVASYGDGTRAFRDLDIRVRDLGLASEPEPGHACQRMRRLIRSTGPDLVVVHEDFPAAAACQADDIAYVFLTHWMLDADDPANSALCDAQGVVFLDEPGRFAIPSYLASRTHHVGPVLRPMPASGISRSRARRDLGLPANSLVIMVAPGIHAHEGRNSIGRTVLDAIDLLPERRARVLWMGGRRDPPRELAAHPSVHWIGFRPDVEVVARAADAAITVGNYTTQRELHSLGVPTIALISDPDSPDGVYARSICSCVPLESGGVTAEDLAAALTGALDLAPACEAFGEGPERREGRAKAAADAIAKYVSTASAEARVPWRRSARRRAVYRRLAAEIPAGSRVLDVGCGAGEELLAHTDCTTLKGEQWGARRIPAPDAAYDVVLGVECLGWVKSPAKFVREVARVLRPTGHLALWDDPETRWPGQSRGPLARERVLALLEEWASCRQKAGVWYGRLTAGAPPVPTLEDEPLVTAIVPTYNRASLVPRSLRSLLRQRYSSLEVIVVDDCSTDGTSSAIEPWLDRVTYIRRTKNRGAGAACNLGLAHARGRYVCFMDDDDIAPVGRLAYQVRALELDQTVSAVFGDTSYFVERGARDSSTDKPRPRLCLEPPPASAWDDTLSRWVFPTKGGALFRTATLRELGGFAEDIPRAEDYELWTRLLAAGRTGALALPTLVYGIHARDRGPSWKRFGPSAIPSMTAVDMTEIAVRAHAHQSLADQYPLCASGEAEDVCRGLLRRARTLTARGSSRAAVIDLACVEDLLPAEMPLDPETLANLAWLLTNAVVRAEAADVPVLTASCQRLLARMGAESTPVAPRSQPPVSAIVPLDQDATDSQVARHVASLMGQATGAPETILVGASQRCPAWARLGTGVVRHVPGEGPRWQLLERGRQEAEGDFLWLCHTGAVPGPTKLGVDLRCLSGDLVAVSSAALRLADSPGRVDALLPGPVPGACVLCAEAVESAGGIRPNPVVGEDLDLWLRISEIGEVLCLPGPGVFSTPEHYDWVLDSAGAGMARAAALSHVVAGIRPERRGTPW